MILGKSLCYNVMEHNATLTNSKPVIYICSRLTVNAIEYRDRVQVGVGVWVGGYNERHHEEYTHLLMSVEMCRT